MSSGQLVSREAGWWQQRLTRTSASIPACPLLLKGLCNCRAGRVCVVLQPRAGYEAKCGWRLVAMDGMLDRVCTVGRQRVGALTVSLLASPCHSWRLHTPWAGPLEPDAHCTAANAELQQRCITCMMPSSWALFPGRPLSSFLHHPRVSVRGWVLDSQRYMLQSTVDFRQLELPSANIGSSWRWSRPASAMAS